MSSLWRDVRGAVGRRGNLPGLRVNPSPPDLEARREVEIRGVRRGGVASEAIVSLCGYQDLKTPLQSLMDEPSSEWRTGPGPSPVGGPGRAGPPMTNSAYDISDFPEGGASVLILGIPGDQGQRRCAWTS